MPNETELIYLIILICLTLVIHLILAHTDSHPGNKKM